MKKLTLFSLLALTLLAPLWPCDDCGPIEMTKEMIQKLSSSSTLKAQGENSYSVKNLFDGDLITCWSEGVKGYGQGEWVEIEFKGGGENIYLITIYPGYLGLAEKRITH
ncbi:MAG: hypothetical protein A2Y33_02605 [Spirochaetes bacterium GWF1_51_8]|nr:MAG: hypothetical protein A2Y33_02605 [Spirochaetes bacterium GWF1_51_8]